MLALSPPCFVSVLKGTGLRTCIWAIYVMSMQSSRLALVTFKMISKMNQFQWFSTHLTANIEFVFMFISLCRHHLPHINIYIQNKWVKWSVMIIFGQFIFCWTSSKCHFTAMCTPNTFSFPLFFFLSSYHNNNNKNNKLTVVVLSLYSIAVLTHNQKDNDLIYFYNFTIYRLCRRWWCRTILFH